jgi:hypothetical protein
MNWYFLALSSPLVAALALQPTVAAANAERTPAKASTKAQTKAAADRVNTPRGKLMFPNGIMKLGGDGVTRGTPVAMCSTVVTCDIVITVTAVDQATSVCTYENKTPLMFVPKDVDRVTWRIFSAAGVRDLKVQFRQMNTDEPQKVGVVIADNHEPGAPAREVWSAVANATPAEHTKALPSLASRKFKASAYAAHVEYSFDTGPSPVFKPCANPYDPIIINDGG